MRYRRDVLDDKYARLRGDRPCKTIVAHRVVRVDHPVEVTAPGERITSALALAKRLPGEFFHNVNTSEARDDLFCHCQHEARVAGFLAFRR